MRERSKFYRILLYILPAVLYFSYYPLISFGSNESMHFEISLPIIWLVVFDVVSLVLVIKRKLVLEAFSKWRYFIFPIVATFSLIWSANRIRGLLTIGVLWLIFFAMLSFYLLREEFKEKNFWRNLWRVFIGSSLVVVAWCLIQCILDVMGVPRENTLMCEGCVSTTFGFPHPNGFAIEPQFMGNLLLAPTIMTGIFWFNNHSKKMLALLFVLLFGVFLTFSRGAIYALIVAMIFFTAMKIVETKKAKALLIWPVIILSFVFTLNVQGMLAAVSPTDDTYFSGISKVLNHLSLGIIDFRTKDSGEVGAVVKGNVVLEDPAEYLPPDPNALIHEEERLKEEAGEEVTNKRSSFDGYVEDSTNIRMQLTGAAMKTWVKNPVTILFGVGIGGAGQAMYDASNVDWPKEIVQNEYASLLLETGLIGTIALVITGVMVLKQLKKSKQFGLTLTVLVGYGITLLFFAGLPNVIHLYLIPAIMPYGRN